MPDTSDFTVAKVSNNPTTPMVQWYKDNLPPQPSECFTFTTQPFYKANDEKVSSELIGPIELSVSKVIDLDKNQGVATLDFNN